MLSRILKKIFNIILKKSNRKVDTTAVVSPLSIVRKSDIGTHTYISSFVTLRSVVLGNYCSIGPGCTLGAMSHLGAKSTSFTLYPHGSEVLTKLKGDVWVGANAVIISGVEIGVGSIIGAGSIVTKDVPPFSIVYGVPAEVKGVRFSDAEIQKLLDSCYWEKKPEEATRILNSIIS